MTRESAPPRGAGKRSDAPAEPAKKKESTLEFIASIASVLVVGLFIITFNLQAFEIPSSSMENTLLIGDHVFVDRIAFAPRTHWIGPIEPYREVHHNDIMVFLSPATPGLYVVKRIIGIPGDHIHLRNGVVYRNGQALDEKGYVIHSVGDYQDYRDNFPSVPPSFGNNVTQEWQLMMRNYIQGEDIVVPPDAFFGMGDNRDVSYDSRFWGFIPRENVIGRPLFIYWSFDTPESEIEKTSLGDRLSFVGHVVLHFFDKTRWNRTLRLVK